LNTIKLLFWSGIAYGLLLVLVRGAFPSESTPTISLTGIPLIVLVVIIARHLTRKSTTPTVSRAMARTIRIRGDSVHFISGQFRVAANASNSYFENVVRARLRELLTTKVALETGQDNETVRRILSDPREGPPLLRDESLYRMLYGPTPQIGPARISMISEAIDLIGAWKG
jgi:hypothetical protein